jgi:xanthine dehydrogenase accessory factor
MSDPPLVAIRGGGDLGSACAMRLYRCGFRIAIAEREKPTAVRRTVAFAEAIFDGRCAIEGVTGVLAQDSREIETAWAAAEVPVLVDTSMVLMLSLRPDIVVDALMAKENHGMSVDLAAGTIGLGPGFTAGVDVHAVVETNRGPNLGLVLWQGSAEDNTHIPAPVGGHSEERVLRAPRDGTLRSNMDIGAIVQQGESIANVSGTPVLAPFEGVVRGLLRPGLEVTKGMKIGDVDPRLDPSLCYRVSDKALAVAGGAVEASLVLLRQAGWKLSLTTT